MTIWKFAFAITDRFSIQMPQGATVLHVDNQRGTTVLWAMVNPKAKVVERKFRLAGTGHVIDDAKPEQHIGSFQMRDGLLVFHLFDLGEA